MRHKFALNNLMSLVLVVEFSPVKRDEMKETMIVVCCLTSSNANRTRITWNVRDTPFIAKNRIKRKRHLDIVNNCTMSEAFEMDPSNSNSNTTLLR